MTGKRTVNIGKIAIYVILASALLLFLLQNLENDLLSIFFVLFVGLTILSYLIANFINKKSSKKVVHLRKSALYIIPASALLSLLLVTFVSSEIVSIEGELYDVILFAMAILFLYTIYSLLKNKGEEDAFESSTISSIETSAEESRSNTAEEKNQSEREKENS